MLKFLLVVQAKYIYKQGTLNENYGYSTNFESIEEVDAFLEQNTRLNSSTPNKAIAKLYGINQKNGNLDLFVTYYNKFNTLQKIQHIFLKE